MLRQLYDTILKWDYIVWYKVNAVWHTPFLDYIIPFLRNQWFWAPLYLFLLIFMPLNYKKSGWLWCLGFIISFAISDQLSAHLMKPIFHRIRPCNDPFLSHIVHRLVDCGSGFSFPSSHAANHFSMGTFAAITFKDKYRSLAFISILWASSISYAQVYVGVHFPLDVLVGGMLGICVGMFTGMLFLSRIKLVATQKITT